MTDPSRHYHTGDCNAANFPGSLWRGYPDRNARTVPCLRWITWISIAFLLGAGCRGVAAESRNGFGLEEALVPADQIFLGSPLRDGIPAIDTPKFLPARESAGLRADDRVFGIARNDVAKAYPINILSWNELVNDRFGDEAVVITFCPL